MDGWLVPDKDKLTIKAMSTELKELKTENKRQARQISHLSKSSREAGQEPPTKRRRIAPPSWVLDKPNNLKEEKQYEGKTWRWCPKCGDSGKWVCSHHPDKHNDKFVSSKKKSAAGDDKKLRLKAKATILERAKGN